MSYIEKVFSDKALAGEPVVMAGYRKRRQQEKEANLKVAEALVRVIDCHFSNQSFVRDYNSRPGWDITCTDKSILFEATIGESLDDVVLDYFKEHIGSHVQLVNTYLLPKKPLPEGVKRDFVEYGIRVVIPVNNRTIRKMEPIIRQFSEPLLTERLDALEQGSWQSTEARQP